MRQVLLSALRRTSCSCLCFGGERHAAGEPGQCGEAAADDRAVRAAVPAALLDALRQEVREPGQDPQLGEELRYMLLLQDL